MMIRHPFKVGQDVVCLRAPLGLIELQTYTVEENLVIVNEPFIKLRDTDGRWCPSRFVDANVSDDDRFLEELTRLRFGRGHIVIKPRELRIAADRLMPDEAVFLAHRILWAYERSVSND